MLFVTLVGWWLFQDAAPWPVWVLAAVGFAVDAWQEGRRR